jgi:uncharacterized membrane protein
MQTGGLSMLSDTVLVLHIAGGLVAVAAGYAALSAPKGGRVHRFAGRVFAVAMLVMVGFAAVLGLAKSQYGNVFAALLTTYLVGTGWTAVRRPGSAAPAWDRGAMLFAVGLAFAGPAAGLLGLKSAAGSGGFYAFGALAGLAAALDLSVLRRGGAAGFARIRRHLWRMCTAMFIATGSFFLGQADEIPRALHGPHLFVLGLAPLGALAFWMARTRGRRRRRPIAAPAPA